jgi:hypothetical protein
MLKKPRKVPKELMMLRSLNARMLVPDSDLWVLEKGYIGELRFDSLTDEMLEGKCWIINGLWLKVGNSTFQIDKVLIYGKKIYLIDVKNFEGDYHYDCKGRLRKGDKYLKDPVHQLKRADDSFHQLLQQYGFNFDIESYIIYVNPEYTQYNAPQNEFVIFPTQLKRFIKKLNSEYSKLNEGHEKLAELLVSLDLVDSPFATVPQYSYQGLRKGIISFCHQAPTQLNRDKLVCVTCGAEEPVNTAIIRSVRELIMLFPDMKITTNLVYDWCGGVINKKRINRVLIKHFSIIGHGKYAYYVPNPE